MATSAAAEAPVARRPDAPIPSGGEARPVRAAKRRWTAGRKGALALAALVAIVAAVLIWRHLGA